MSDQKCGFCDGILLPGKIVDHFTICINKMFAEFKAFKENMAEFRLYPMPTTLTDLSWQVRSQERFEERQRLHRQRVLLAEGHSQVKSAADAWALWLEKCEKGKLQDKQAFEHWIKALTQRLDAVLEEEGPEEPAASGGSS